MFRLIRENWPPLVALVLILSFLVFSMLPNRSFEQNAIVEGPSSVCGSEEAKPPCLHIADEPVRQTPTIAELDLIAQNRMALWTFVMGICGVFGIGISSVGIFLLYQTLRETRLVTTATKEVGEAPARAYVHAEGATFEQSRTPGDKFPNAIILYIQNTGLSPALEITIESEIHIYTKVDNPDRLLNNPAAKAKLVDLEGVKHTPPGQGIEKTVGYFPGFFKAYLNLQTAKIEFIGSVNYKDVFGKSFVSDFRFTCISVNGYFSDKMEKGDHLKRIYKPV